MHELSAIDENIDETDLQKLMNGRWIDIHGGPSKLVLATQHQLVSFDSMIGQDGTNWKEGSSYILYADLKKSKKSYRLPSCQ
jgi:hypothetical protein